jgi:glycosyltransferase involved in cell wall biosynthesis
VKRLHVGVNLLWLVPGVVGGSEEYTTRLIAALLDYPPEDLDLTLFVLRPFVDAYPDLAEAVPTVVCSLSGKLKAVRVGAEASWLAMHARRRKVDLLHHAGGTMPLLRATPSIVTIHDLQPLLLPDNFIRAKQAYLRWRLPATARHSRLVITLTDYTKLSIAEELHVPSDRIAVVRPGYTPALAESPQGDPREIYDISGPFFLYPAITYPHKNHKVLIEAFAKVVRRHPSALLVLTHRPAESEQEMLDLIGSLGIGDSIRRLGHIERGDLNWLYQHAVALTFPSRFEGFGLPVLEAMGHGCPVIAAAATALPEVVGAYGVLVDPDDPDAWAAAMIELLTNEERREWLAEAAIARTAEFRWSSSAEQLERAYRQAGDGLS